MAKRSKNVEDDALKFLEQFDIGNGELEKLECIPTGHFALDFAINKGENPSSVDLDTIEDYDPSEDLGLPLGKLVEIYGDEGSGKSSLAYRVAGYAQKKGYNVAWLDAENSFSMDLAEINGCDYTKIIKPDNKQHAEYFLDMIKSLCNAPKIPQKINGKKVYLDPPKVIVLDSIASLIPKSVEESLSEQQFVGLLARLLSQNLPKIASAAERNNVLVILINQLREKIGVMFGKNTDSPGGRALKHLCSIRLEVIRKTAKDARIYRVDEETGESSLIGGHSYVGIAKNRFGKPVFEKLLIPIYYENYFPSIAEVAFDMGRQVKLISVYKGEYRWNELKIKGRQEFIKKVKEDNLLSELINDVKAKTKEQGVILPPELLKYEEQDNEEKEAVSRSRKGKNSSSSKKKSKKK